jgi:hypothetical protein
MGDMGARRMDVPHKSLPSCDAKAQAANEWMNEMHRTLPASASVLDMNRTTVVFQTVEDLADGINRILDDPDLDVKQGRSRNLYLMSTVSEPGHRDITIWPVFHGMLVEIKLVWWPFVAFRDVAQPISALWNVMSEWCEGVDGDPASSLGARIGHVRLRDAVDHYDGVHPKQPGMFQFVPPFAEPKADDDDDEDAANRRKIHFIDRPNYDLVEKSYAAGKSEAEPEVINASPFM